MKALRISNQLQNSNMIYYTLREDYRCWMNDHGLAHYGKARVLEPRHGSILCPTEMVKILWDSNSE